MQQLGFKAEEAIRAHFGRYAGIDGVLDAHSNITTACGRFARRVRQSNFAIIIMASEAAVTAIHSMGRDQIVGGVSVRVERFKHIPFPWRDQRAEKIRHAKGDGESRSATTRKESSISIAPKAVGPKAAGLVATIDSNVSTCDSLNLFSGESDDDCRVHSDFEYYATDDGF